MNILNPPPSGAPATLAPDLDQTAENITHDVLDACLLRLELAGVPDPVRKALAAAYLAIARTDAIAGPPLTGDGS
jgi:hypothetical protein